MTDLLSSGARACRAGRTRVEAERPRLEHLGRVVEAASSGTWVVLPPLLVTGPRDISIGDDGTLWAVDQRGHVFSYDGQRWRPMTGLGTAIAVSAADAQHIYVTTSDLRTTHWYLTSSGWKSMPLTGTTRSASGAADGTIWAINGDGKLVRYLNDQQSFGIQASMDRVSVGSEGEVWGTLNGSVIHLVDYTPQIVDGVMKQVSVGSDGRVWGIDAYGAVYERLRGFVSWYDRWVQQPDAPALVEITVGSRFMIAGVGFDGKIYLYQPDGLAPTLRSGDIDELLMCARFASWAYRLYPSEVQGSWWSPPAEQTLAPIFAGTLWQIQNTYNDGLTSTDAYLAYSTIENEGYFYVILSIRGSQEMLDWFADFTLYAHLTVSNGIGVSLWVRACWGNISQAVIADLQNLIGRLGGDKIRLYVVGHSLGAAIATYAAYALASGGAVAAIPSGQIKVVNFGSPPVGDPAFVSAFAQTGIGSARVINPNDGILLVADNLGSWSAGARWADVATLTPTPTFGESKAQGHSIDGYIDVLERLEQGLEPAPSTESLLRALDQA